MSQLTQNPNFSAVCQGSNRPPTQESGAVRHWAPDVDVWEDRTEIVLEVMLPGMKPEVIGVQARGDLLRISSQTQRVSTTCGDFFHHIERHSGSFQRLLVILAPVDEEQAAVSYHLGVPTLLAVPWPRAA